MIRPKRRLALRSGLIAILLLIGVPVWVVGRAYRRERATHDLAIALYNNDTKSALSALRAGADPNARRFEHEVAPTPGQTLRRFLQQLHGGKTLSESEADHRPPMLALAAEKNNIEVVKALLKDGAFPDAHARYREGDRNGNNDPTDGKTALMLSAEHNNSGTAQALLDSGANPNFNDTDWCEAPLLQTTDPTVMEELLTHGADIHVQRKQGNSSGITPLRFLMLRSVSFDTVTAQSRRRCSRCLDVLLAHGADINEDGDRNKSLAEHGYFSTAIELMSENGDPASIRYLLSKGADISASHGRDALAKAIFAGKADNLRILLAHGVDPNQCDKDSRTPLFYAVEQGEDEPVKALIAGGAKVDVRDKHGKTPLQLANEDNKASIADILRAVGARR